MSESRRGRQGWEYAEGPAVGHDVPITSEPREETASGAPVPPEPDTAAAPPERDTAAPAGANEQERREDSNVQTEEREVRARDPELSPETNARVTAELRDVVGTDRARVPVDRPQAAEGEKPEQAGALGWLSMNRFQLIRSSAIVLTFGAVVALATGTWWVLPLAAGVHALGTMTVMLTAIRMTTYVEHPSPQLAAAMSEEGITSPDEHFTRMVEEFRDEPGQDGTEEPAQEARQEPERGTTEVISPGFNERSEPAEANTSRAAAEQQSAVTPTGQPSESSGAGGAPDLLIWATVFSLLVLSIVLPAIGGGGWLWLLPAVMVPLLLGWGVLQWLMMAHPNHAPRPAGRLMAIIIISTGVAVAAFCALVALAFQH